MCPICVYITGNAAEQSSGLPHIIMHSECTRSRPRLLLRRLALADLDRFVARDLLLLTQNLRQSRKSVNLSSSSSLTRQPASSSSCSHPPKMPKATSDRFKRAHQPSAKSKSQAEPSSTATRNPIFNTERFGQHILKNPSIAQE